MRDCDGVDVAPFTTELSSNVQPRPGSFDDQVSFHLREACHDMKKESVQRCAGIDRIGETLELDVLFVQIADQLYQLFD